MRVIKLGIISLIAFAVLITLFSLFFPSRIRISRALDLHTGRAAVLDLIKDTASWKNWYPGAGSASVLPLITAFTDSSVTATSTLANGRKGITGWTVYDPGYPNIVTLQWYMDFKLRWYPWEKFSGLLFEKRYGPVLEKGLENLRQKLENQ